MDVAASMRDYLTDGWATEYDDIERFVEFMGGMKCTVYGLAC